MPAHVRLPRDRCFSCACARQAAGAAFSRSGRLGFAQRGSGSGAEVPNVHCGLSRVRREPGCLAQHRLESADCAALDLLERARGAGNACGGAIREGTRRHGRGILERFRFRCIQTNQMTRDVPVQGSHTARVSTVLSALYSVARHNVRVYKARTQMADLKQFLACSHSLCAESGICSVICVSFGHAWRRQVSPASRHAFPGKGPSPIAHYPRSFKRCIFTPEGKNPCLASQSVCMQGCVYL